MYRKSQQEKEPSNKIGQEESSILKAKGKEKSRSILLTTRLERSECSVAISVYSSSRDLLMLLLNSHNTLNYIEKQRLSFSIYHEKNTDSLMVILLYFFKAKF